MTTGHTNSDNNISVALLGNARSGHRDTPDVIDTSTLVYDDSKRIGTIAFENEGGELAGTLTATDLLIEAEGEEHGSSRCEAGIEKQFDGLEDRNKLVLAVR